MSAIDHALKILRYKIPPQILQVVFAPVYNPGQRQVYLSDSSIDAAIREHVIDGRVRPEIDLMGANELDIPLTGLTPEFLPLASNLNQVGMTGAIYKIPSDRLNGRTICSVLALTYGISTSMGGGLNVGNSVNFQADYTPLLDSAHQAMKAVSPIAVVENANCYIIGHNTVSVEGWSPQLGNYGWLRVLVTHDPEMSTFPLPYWNLFSRVVTLAVKSYIYNNFIIKMNEAVLAGGRELGKFGEIVEGYADAEDMYEELLNEKFRKANFLADPKRKQRLIKMMSGGLW